MKVLGSIFVVFGLLMASVGVFAVSSPHGVHGAPESGRLSGLALISVVASTIGVALFRARLVPVPPTPDGRGPSWLDRPFVGMRHWVLIVVSLFVTVPMCIAAGVAWAFGRHPVARQRAAIVFSSSGAYLFLWALLWLITNTPPDDRAAKMALAAAPELNVTVPADFVRHSVHGGVSVCWPTTWRTTNSDDATTLVTLRPADAKGGAVNIMSVPQSPGQTLARYIEQAPSLAANFSDFRLIAADLVKMDGRPAARLIYDTTMPDSGRTRICQYVRLVGERQYVISFAAPTTQYDELRPAADRIAVSTRLPGDPAPVETLAAAARPSPPRSTPSSPPPLRPDPPRPEPLSRAPMPLATERVAPERPTEPRPQVAPPTTAPVLAERKWYPPGGSMLADTGDGQTGDGWPVLPQQPRPHLARSRPSIGDKPPVLPEPEKAAEQLRRITAGWKPANGRPTELLATMAGGVPGADGITLNRRDKAATPIPFTPPVTFHIVLLTQGNDTRVAFIADQIIFNWEMRPTELRVDGGPASGRHAKGAGALPAGEWVGIELKVTDDEMVIYVNGRESYRTAASFAGLHAPLAVTAHNGTVKLRSVTVFTP